MFGGLVDPHLIGFLYPVLPTSVISLDRIE
jgi:hypothetical protein